MLIIVSLNILSHDISICISRPDIPFIGFYDRNFMYIIHGCKPHRFFKIVPWEHFHFQITIFRYHGNWNIQIIHKQVTILIHFLCKYSINKKTNIHINWIFPCIIHSENVHGFIELIVVMQFCIGICSIPTF